MSVNTNKRLGIIMHAKPVVSHGYGVRVFTRDGADLIDCAAGTFNLSVGYSHPEIVAVYRDQAAKLIHCSTRLRNETVELLEQRLTALSPIPNSKVHLKVGGGSEANEGAIKMAQYHLGKHEIVSFWRSHLGQTIYTMSLSGGAFRQEPFRFQIPGNIKVPPPYCRRCFYGKTPGTCGLECAAKIDDFIEYASASRIGAIIIEPIFGNGDNIVCPPAVATQLRNIATRHGAALILDEIQTGIGRTGTLFATEWLGIVPDMITIAKGLGGSGGQIAAILAAPEYGNLPLDHHAFTYGGNVLACAVANKTLDLVAQPEFLAHVRSMGAFLTRELKRLAARFPFCDEVRGRGLMIGIEIVDANGEPDAALTNEIASRAFAHGLILRTSRYGRGNVVKIRPPLIITRDESVELLERLEACFQDIALAYKPKALI